MITKQDTLLLLTEMREKGIDTDNDIIAVVKSDAVPLEVIKR